MKRLSDIAAIKAAATARKQPPYREIYRSKYTYTHIVETRPQCRMVRFGLKKRFYLSFPYMVWMSQCNGLTLYVGFRNEPMKSPADTMYFPPLPNFNNFNVCLGKEFKRGTPIIKLMDRFWSARFAGTTRFSFESWSGWSFLQASSLKTLDNWQEMSRSNPLGILETDWAMIPRQFSYHEADRRVIFGSEAYQTNRT